MKTTLFLILTVLFLSSLFLPSGFAQYVSYSTLEGHRGDVYSIAFSPDGTTLASGSWDSTMRLWDAVTGAPKHTLEGHRGDVYSIAFSPDGTTLASGGWDNTVRLWDAVTGAHKYTLEGHRGDVYSIAFSPDGTTLASGGWDNTVRLWDAVTGAHKYTLEGHRGDVYSIAFSPDGTTLASGSSDNTVRLWDAVTGAHKATLEGHWGTVYSVAFSPDGSTLASGGYDDTIRLWELPSTRVHITTPPPVESLAIGSSLIFSLNIADGENIAGYQATVGFNSTVLRYVESANGDYLPTGAFFVPPVVKENRVTLAATTLAGTSGGSGTLATLTFKVVDIRKSLPILSDARLTDSDGNYLPLFASSTEIVEPAAAPSSAVISVTPSSMLSPAIGQQLIFNVDIAGGQNVAGYQLTWESDSTALKYISGSEGGLPCEWGWQR